MNSVTRNRSLSECLVTYLVSDYVTWTVIDSVIIISTCLGNIIYFLPSNAYDHFSNYDFWRYNSKPIGPISEIQYRFPHRYNASKDWSRWTLLPVSEKIASVRGSTLREKMTYIRDLTRPRVQGSLGREDKSPEQCDNAAAKVGLLWSYLSHLILNFIKIDPFPLSINNFALKIWQHIILAYPFSDRLFSRFSHIVDDDT
jgi:hypothetical protein